MRPSAKVKRMPKLQASPRKAVDMGERAEGLATKLESAHNDLLAAISAASGDEWRSICTDGEWTKGYAAYHAAASTAGITGMAQTLASGNGPPPGTAGSWDEINAMNAQH